MGGTQSLLDRIIDLTDLLTPSVISALSELLKDWYNDTLTFKKYAAALLIILCASYVTGWSRLEFWSSTN